jgi:peptide/nickel transport system ATP-binding protein/oligopeptide transport system ATP-binding protein
MPEKGQAVLDVKGLKTVFRTRGGEIHAVNEVDFSLQPGELLGVVGESGSGKSVTMMSLLGLLPSPPADVRGGTAMFEGRDLLKLTAEELRTVRGARIGFIFQDPMTSLNPVFSVGKQIMEPLRKHMGLGRRAAQDRAVELLELVGIPGARQRLGDYPHQFSGGMRQRVMIAIALACDPKVLIADEPTTALDVTIQAQILELMKELRQKLGMAVIWITHDLGVIAGIADRVMVMYAGQVVEHAPVKELFRNPQHPYTKALLTTVPSIRAERARRLTTIEGQPPMLNAPPVACSFRDRCSARMEICDRLVPQRYPIGNGHDAACFLADPGLAPAAPAKPAAETAPPGRRLRAVPSTPPPSEKPAEKQPPAVAQKPAPAAPAADAPPAAKAEPETAAARARRRRAEREAAEAANPSGISISGSFKIGGDNG